MIALGDVPISSSSWLVGAVALLILGVKSLLGYRRSRVQLSKYITWFALLICASLFCFSIPAFFTLDMHTMLTFDLIGEGFFYASMVAQAAIVWFLMLRTRTSAYILTVPVALIGLAAWLYAIPRSTTQYLRHDFITYQDPRLSTLAIALLIIALFVPVGIYFLRLAPRQTGFKARLNSVIFGIVYIGIGLVNGGFELVTGQMMTTTSVYGIILFFIFLLIAALWPRRAGAKPSVQIPGAVPAPESESQPAPADQNNLTAPPNRQV